MLKKLTFQISLFFILFITIFPLNLILYAQDASQSAVASPSATLTPEPTLIPTTTPEVTPVAPATPSATIAPSPLPLEPSPVINDSATLLPVPKVRFLTKKDFEANEKIELTLENTDSSEIKMSLKDNKDNEVPVLFEEETINQITTLKIKPPNNFKPGKYTLTIVDRNGQVTKQEFTWGVLAINPNKSIYLPNENVKLSMAVLNNQGKMVCDANLELRIKNSELGIDDLLSNENGKITVNPDCVVYNKTANPDYEANYHAGSAGKYSLTLKAQTKDGNYTITDSFEVRDNVPFDIERVGPTRIYVPEKYRMGFNIKFNQDFNGEITEIVPESFTTYSDEKFPYENVKVVSLDKGKSSSSTINLGYPLAGQRLISQQFGKEETDPLLKTKYDKYGVIGHDGVDFDLAEGTPILSVDEGEIVLAEDWDYGLTLVVRHSWGQSYYGHLKEFKALVGQKVKKGEEIGLSGDTGLSTGPHLHFGIKLKNNNIKNGYFGKVDPLPFLGESAEISGFSVKQINWKVNAKSGDVLSFVYDFITPKISPEFYLLGPLTMKQSNNETMVYGESRQWQIAADAPPNLDTLYPTAYSSQTGTAWTTTTVTNIDEGIAAADGLFIVAGANSTSSIFYDITDTPTGFVKMTTLNYDIRYKITPLSNDTEVLYVQVFKSDKTTALTNEMTVVSTTTALTIRNKGSTAFTGVSTTATKADWDAAYFRIRTTHSASGGKDNSIWSIDGFELTGTYQLSPTVALNTPTNTQTITDTTPTLNFTGTDINSDTVEYNVQVDTVNSFDGNTTVIASNDETTVDSSITIFYGTPGNNVGGQTFTSTSSIPLTSVKFYLKKFGSPTGNVPVELKATSGGVPTGSVLATSSNLDISTLTTSYQLIEFTFSSPYTLAASTMYSLTLTPVNGGGTDNANYIVLGVDASSPGYSGGTALAYASPNVVTAASDAGFYTYNKAPLLSKFSVTPDAGFTSGHPFASGTAIDYTVQAGDALAAGTYYWRVAAIDPLGSNTYGAWSSPTWSFTVAASGPTTDQLMRHGKWFNSSGVRQPFTF